jgi:hypothetical protein
MEPPIHTEYLLSGHAMIFSFVVDGTTEIISFCIRSATSGTLVVFKKKDRGHHGT